ncbi:MAG: NupC/NupG family nucleoside CNT transporter [bacterium]
MERLISVLGCFVFLAMAWLFSNNKRQINYRVVLWGLLLQALLAFIILKTSFGYTVFFYVGAAITKLLSFTDAGISWLIGDSFRNNLDGAKEAGSSLPIQVWNPENSQFVTTGIVVALYILPAIVFFASLTSVLYYSGVMQKIVTGMAKVTSKLLGTSGAESLSVASNVFVGPIEGALLVKPYISGMTRSELMAIMTGGFATITGGFMALYVHWGFDVRHLLAASVMSAPAALVMAKIIFPETETLQTRVNFEKKAANVLDAAVSGAKDGLKIALTVGAAILVFMAVIAMMDFCLLKVGGLFGLGDLTLEKILGYAFAPVALIMGIETADVLNIGYLLGTKVALNEFVAFVKLGQWQVTLSPRSFTIGTYALCGFANFSMIAIQIAGIGGIAPERKQDVAKLAFKAMCAGALASWLTATIAGILI